MQKPDDARAAGLPEKVLTGDEADALVNATSRTEGKPLSDEEVYALATRIVEESDRPVVMRRINTDLVPAMAKMEKIPAMGVIDFVVDTIPGTSADRAKLKRLINGEVETARKKLHEGTRGPDKSPLNKERYRVCMGQMCHVSVNQTGTEYLEDLANFHARIAEEVVLDDGSGEDARFFVLEGGLADFLGGKPLPPVRVRVGAFSGMGWVSEVWGASPCVNAGQGAKDHLRCAIQVLSGANIPTKRIFRHLGWRKLDDHWVYLHVGGGIGPDGAEPGIDVDLDGGGALRHFVLPDPPEGDALRDSIRASLRMLDVAPHDLTMPIYAAIWRAPLGSVNFSIQLTGATGNGKSEIVALVQRHYGKEMDAEHLPANWSSTANSLESTAFLTKDAILTVDDYAPSGAIGERERYNHTAERFFRSVGNHAGRQRLNSDAKHRVERPPRCLPLSTGEDIPGRLASLRARLVGLDIGPGDMFWERLTPCQADAAGGLYAKALAGYLRWVAPRYEEITGKLETDRDALTNDMQGTHKRTPRNVASLAVGFQWFLRYARETGAIRDDQAKALWCDCLDAMQKTAAAQTAWQDGCDPAVRFMELIGSALSSGKAFVSDIEGNRPPIEEARRWGWQAQASTLGGVEWKPPQGRPRIGWVAGEDLYLDPDAAYKVAQDVVGSGSGEGIAVSTRTLWKRMNEAKMLASTELPRTLSIRRVIEGGRRNVIHVRSRSLVSTLENMPNLPTGSVEGGGVGRLGRFSQTDRTRQGDDIAIEIPAPNLTSTQSTPRINEAV